MMASPSSLQRGGSLGKWVRAIVILRFVSVLFWRLFPNDAWITDLFSSLVALLFVLYLCWALLSRHVLPFLVQDFSVSWLSCHQVVCAARKKLGQSAVKCKEVVWLCMERMIHGMMSVFGRIRSTMQIGRRRSGNSGDEANETEQEIYRSLFDVQLQSEASDSLVMAPSSNVMERLEDVKEDVHEEQVSPKLLDKKKW